MRARDKSIARPPAPHISQRPIQCSTPSNLPGEPARDSVDPGQQIQPTSAQCQGENTDVVDKQGRTIPQPCDFYAVWRLRSGNGR
ncbi:hypothetical protein OG21DRAFT_1510491 [Imleria badia]|nr:hypothetical protein OG21DRAFT_1510491 [Imleria badia]